MRSSIGKDHILVIKLGALGDFVQSLGAMAAVRAYHKEAHITLLTTSPYEDFARRSGYFDDIWLDTRPKWFDLVSWFLLRKRLIKGAFTRVYDLQNNDRTAFYLRLFPKGSCPEWVGAASGASHRNSDPSRTQGTAFEGHKQTLALAGLHDVAIDDMRWIDDDISDFALKAPFVLLVPGCSPQHPQKRWPVRHYVHVAQMLSEEGYQPVVLGSMAEDGIAQEIKRLCPAVLNLAGKTSLFQIISLAQKAYAAIGNDTGPMHLIGPTNCRTFVLFSAHGDPKKHAPNGECVHVLQQDNLEELSPQCVMEKYLRH